MTYTTQLTTAQIQAAQAQAQSIANSATTAVSNKTFVFVAAFVIGVRFQLNPDVTTMAVNVDGLFSAI